MDSTEEQLRNHKGKNPKFTTSKNLTSWKSNKWMYVIFS